MGEKQPGRILPDHKEDWFHVSGDYGRDKSIVAERPTILVPEKNIPIQELRGNEFFFRDIISYYLKKNKGSTKPTIAWDSGALAATTWVRLACSFRDNIKRGELALVASSRTFLPSETGFNALWRLPTELQTFLEENHHLVHYLRADARSFREMAIDLPGGRHVNILGQVQIAHEVDALSRYSSDPETEIELLAEMVSEDGIYFTRGGFPYSDHLDESRYRDNGHFLGVLKAHSNLTGLGFTLVIQVESGLRKDQDLIYAVFRKPGSPQIIVG